MLYMQRINCKISHRFWPALRRNLAIKTWPQFPFNQRPGNFKKKRKKEKKKKRRKETNSICNNISCISNYFLWFCSNKQNAFIWIPPQIRPQIRSGAPVEQDRNRTSAIFQMRRNIKLKRAWKRLAWDSDAWPSAAVDSYSIVWFDRWLDQLVKEWMKMGSLLWNGIQSKENGSRKSRPWPMSRLRWRCHSAPIRRCDIIATACGSHMQTNPVCKWGSLDPLDRIHRWWQKLHFPLNSHFPLWQSLARLLFQQSIVQSMQLICILLASPHAHIN